MTQTLRTLLASLLALLAIPAAASAATVSASNGKITFTALSGEANHLTVSLQNGQYRFEDTGVSSMTAGSGCSLAPGQRVNCSSTGITSVTADLGDGSDWMSGGVLLPFTVHGGLGNDVITIFAGNDVIDGGPGNDTLDAGWGNDTIDGGDGADVISGGYGTDTVVYATRTASVSVSLDDVANDGAAGEGDNVRPTIDNVIGGSGSDTLTGDVGANQLTGNGGDDSLDGGTGDDVLDGGAGTDSFAGGAGVDSLKARDGVVETLACGSEADTAEADYNDNAVADCEVVNRDVAPEVPVDPGTPPPPPVVEPAPILPPSPTGGTGSVIEAPVATISSTPIAVSASGVAPVRIKCPSEAFEGCAGTIVIETLDAGSGSGKLDVKSARRRKKPKPKRRKLASRKFNVAAGQGKTIPVRLDRRVWRKFKKKKRVKVQITVTMENSTGTTTSTQTVTFKPQPPKGTKDSG